MKIVFECKNGHEGHIELLDNEYMDFWKDVFLKNKAKTTNVRSYRLPYGDEQSTKRKYVNETEAVDAINKTLHKLHDLGWYFNHWAYVGMSAEQLNKLHREFTTSLITKCKTFVALSYDDRVEIKLNQFNFNEDDQILRSFSGHHHKPSYEFFDEYILDRLEEINYRVHSIERNHYSERAASHNHHLGVFACFSEKKEDNITDKYKMDYNMGSLANDYGNSSPEYNVYDLKCITGKDYYKAWVDYDDPSEWDVVNNNCTTKGGFEIMPWYSSLCNDHLKPWIKKYGMPTDDKYVSSIPIGRVDEHTLSLMKKKRFETWPFSRRNRNDWILIKSMDLV